MKRLREILLILLLQVVFLNSYGQVASVSTVINKDTVFVGDTLNLTVKVIDNVPGKLKIIFPFFKDTITSNIHILQQDTLPDTLTSQSNKLVLSKTYVISSYDSGMVVVPPLPVIFKLDTVQDTIFTQIQAYFVKLYPTDTLKVPLKDVKKPINTPLTFSEFIHEYGTYIIIALLIIILAYLVIRYFVRKKQGKAFLEIKKSEELPYDRAIRKLNRLKDRKLWQKGMAKAYYAELTEILREYMDGRFGMNTMESTSSEIIDDLKSHNDVPEEIIPDLEKLFMVADLAKFAKYNPLPDENDFAMKKAVEFVEITKPAEKENDEKEENTDVNNGIKNTSENADDTQNR